MYSGFWHETTGSDINILIPSLSRAHAILHKMQFQMMQTGIFSVYMYMLKTTRSSNGKKKCSVDIELKFVMYHL